MSGGTSSPRQSRSFTVAHSAPVPGWNASPTALRSPGGEDPPARAVDVVAQDHGAAAALLAAHVAGGAHRDVEAAVGPDHDRALPVAAARGQVRHEHDRLRGLHRGRVVAEAQQAPGLRHVERAVLEGQAVRLVEPVHHRLDPVGLALAARVGQGQHAPPVRLGHQQGARRVQGHEARGVDLGREHLDGEARGDLERLRAGGRRPREQRQQQREDPAHLRPRRYHS